MIIAGSIVAILAAALHIFIFYIESIAWTSKGITVFGLTPQQAEQTEEMAFNQGFYNLFLAIVAIVGAVFYFSGATSVGIALMFAGVGSMLAAACVLLISSAEKQSAAIKQGVLPLTAVLLLIVGLI